MSRLLPSAVCYTAAIIIASAGLSRAADTPPRTTATTAKAKPDVVRGGVSAARDSPADAMMMAAV